MILARDEVIVNEWEYASSISKKIETTHSLVITNKRIVSTVESPRKLVQREIPISSVQNVTVTHETPSFKGAIFSIVMGILCILLSIAAFVVSFTSFADKLVFLIIGLSVGVVLLILSIVLIAVGIKGLNQGSFTLELSSNILPEYGLMSIGFDKIFSRRRTATKFQLYIDNKVAREIVDTIGAIIIDNK